MEVILLLMILTIFCQNLIAVRDDQQFSRLIFDLTRPVNELIAKEISQQDFRSDVQSAFNLTDGNITTFRIFYATAGSNIEELESRTQYACNILRETLHIDSSTQLLISWKLNGTTIDKLKFSISYNQTFEGCSPKLILHFNKDTGCAGIPNFEQRFYEPIESTNRMFVGVSYDESLHECESLSSWKKYTPILVVNLKFGTTRGVTESFGLFQIRLKFLSETVEFDNKRKPIIYYPNPYSVGKDEHQNLLIRYASIWTTSNKTRGSILLQVPNSRIKGSKMAQFSIIPMLALGRKLNGSLDEDILSSLLWFTASFQQHQMVLVYDNIWELWNRLPERYTRSPKLRNVVSSTHFALDCTVYNCENITLGLNADNEGIIFIEVEDYDLPRIPPKIAEQITPNVTIGCKYEADIDVNESHADHVVRSCKSINGTVYIVATTIALKLYSELGKYSFFFENTIRAELHAVNRFRNAIIEKVPSAKVYFQVFIEEQHGSSFQKYPSINSLFCDEFLPAVNLYVEGIFNWAKLENLPVISTWLHWRGTNFFVDWSPLLRRLNYPYPDWTVKEKGLDEIRSNGVSSPAFLMQDYLKSIHNWEPDSCIDWSERRWEITDDFFHNSKIGTVFHPSSILNNRHLTEDECITMLNFIFYRFRLMEISMNFDFGNLPAAVEQQMASPNFNAQIFVKYAVTEQQQNLPSFKSFIDQLKRSKIYEMGFLKGVHSCLVVEPGINNGRNISNLGNFESVLSMMKYAKLSNVTCGIELPSTKMCNQVLAKFYFTDAYSELFGTINYVVCKENFEWRFSKKELQNLLDSHLALKRILDLMIPDLRLYIRVEFKYFIDFKNNAEVDRYTNFLALLKTFGSEYDINYFVVVAFDDRGWVTKNGWWGIKNYSDLANPQSFVEKVTALRGYPMWYPAYLPSSPSITASNSQDSSLVISAGSTVLLFLVIIGIFFGFRYRKLQRLTRVLSDTEVQEFLIGRGSNNTEPANTEMELMGSAEHMKFNEEHKLALPDLIIDFNKILGSGAFGTVYNGLTKGIPAAIKRPNEDCSKTTFKSVLTEVKVLSYVGNHPNVVGFLGAYVEEIYKGVLYISTELCTSGSLESFLRKKKNVTSQNVSIEDQTTELDGSVLYFRELNIFALEIAKGMEYIESRRVVHGDLSTRNVLLDENLVCKIGDFGLSRKLYEYQKYVKSSQEPLPWTWMAPESLTKMEFTSKTDLWSYGVTLWEIYTLGNIPYSGLNWTVDFANELKNGLRLPSPDFASPEIYAKLLECWNFNSDERPTFADMINFFIGLTEDTYMILNSTEQQPESTIE